MATTIINLSSLNGKNGFRLNGEAYDRSGRSVSNLGDINGDGFADLMIGAPGTDSNGIDSGSSYVVFGKASGFNAAQTLSSLNGTNGFRMDGVSEYDASGNVVSNAGDVNGDGFSDLLIGAYGANVNGILSGSSYVVFGQASGFNSAIDLANLDGSNGFALNGIAGDYSGSSLSSAGDINGDGFADLIVGAGPADGNGNNSGSAYVIFGKASGFGSSLNLASLDGNNGFVIEGNAGDLIGRSVSSAGDVNKDGLDDLLVSAFGASNYAGSTYVVFGKKTGFDDTFDLSSLNGSNGFRLNGVAAYDFSGDSISNAGDVNGDGFDDVIIGAGNASPNGKVGAGSSYVVFGKATGFDASLDLSALDGENGFRIDGASKYDVSGLSVSNAGDVNGDGFDDVIIGSFASPNGLLASGSSYIIFGKASGFGKAIDLSNISSNSGFRLDGAASGDVSGRSVSSAGDVNGDGFDDVIVGAYGTDTNGNYSGSSYVVFGRNFNGKVTAMGTAKADKLKGNQGVDRMVAGDGDDTLIGRGGKDVYHAGAGDDTIKISDLKFQLADGGAGWDTLKLDDSHLNLNLAKERGHISDIEAIDLKGNGANKLTVTALDILNLSSTTNTLKVDGNGNDRVAGLSEGWTDGGIHSGYHTFTNGEAVLLVGVHVATDFF